MRKLLLILITLLFFSCSVIKVEQDYDKDTDFSSYTTYNYFGDLNTGLNELDDKRLIKAIDATMRMKGFLLTEDPDILINILSVDYLSPVRNNVGIGIGGTGRSVGGGVSVGLPVGQSKLIRSITFEFVDSRKNNLFWQGIGRTKFSTNASPEAKEEKLKILVEKVFEKYPQVNL